MEFDAIVVGSGITGGWAAKELCELGLKTLVLERGKDVKHIIDYDTANLNPWDFKYRLLNNPLESFKHFFVNNSDHPYIQETPYDWIRGYQVGGRSLTWGRQCYRLSPMDFTASLNDNIGIEWPIRYKDIAKWYDYVEDFVGISGEKANLPQLPDSKFLPPIPLNCVELHFANQIEKKFPGRKAIPQRIANLTIKHKGRGPCQYQNQCKRGCVYSGYFSSNSATLPAAEQTNNMTLRPNSIVKEVIYDHNTKKALGVKIIDSETNEELVFYGKIIFLNASTIATAAILLNSKSETFPNGLGNSSGQIGHNLMGHIMGPATIAEYNGYQNSYYTGNSPGGIYIPRFKNLTKKNNSSYYRGYALIGMAYRKLPTENNIQGFGADLKNKLSQPGKWEILFSSRGKMLPYFNNRIALDSHKKDKWGMPLIKVFCEYGDNENNMLEDIKIETEKMLSKAGFSNIHTFRKPYNPGAEIHEMGTVRMGKDPKTSVLNKHNQMHDVKNVFITDGSCMTSSASQNPSLTYMALTARACHYSFDLLKNNVL
ncbi:GMC family oxidoreductase [Aureispira]|nr:GMC family oxidoreductase [Aureispira sp.]